MNRSTRHVYRPKTIWSHIARGGAFALAAGAICLIIGLGVFGAVPGFEMGTYIGLGLFSLGIVMIAAGLVNQPAR